MTSDDGEPAMSQRFLPASVLSFKPALTERRYNAPQIPGNLRTKNQECSFLNHEYHGLTRIAGTSNS